MLVFPESVIADWSEATDLFWSATISNARTSGQTFLVGATIPVETQHSFDFAPDLASLAGRPSLGPAAPAPAHYRNVIVLRGETAETFHQRIPVPFGMWKPFTGTGVPLNLGGRASIDIAGQRAAILICYEQLLTWTVLTAMAENPSLVLAISNLHAVANYADRSLPVRRRPKLGKTL